MVSATSRILSVPVHTLTTNVGQARCPDPKYVEETNPGRIFQWAFVRSLSEHTSELVFAEETPLRHWGTKWGDGVFACLQYRVTVTCGVMWAGKGEDDLLILFFLQLPAVFFISILQCAHFILHSAHFCLKRNWKCIMEELVASKVKSLSLSSQKKKKSHLKKINLKCFGINYILKKKKKLFKGSIFFNGRVKNNLDVGLACGWQWEFAAVGIKSQRPKMILAKKLIWNKNVYKEARMRLRWKPDFMSDDILGFCLFQERKDQWVQWQLVDLSWPF